MGCARNRRYHTASRYAQATGGCLYRPGSRSYAGSKPHRLSREALMRRDAGFTLLELLVALTIFSLIGLGAHTMLHSILQARETEASHALHLPQLQKTR